MVFAVAINSRLTRGREVTKLPRTRLFPHRSPTNIDCRGSVQAIHQARAFRGDTATEVVTLHSFAASVLALNHHLLGFSNCLRRVQALRASLRTVHYGMTAIQSERILQFIEAFTGRIIAAVD